MLAPLRIYILLACALILTEDSLLAQGLSNPPIDITGSLENAAGPKYRKIALNGSILPDEKPQATAETDESKEETFVDAMTDTLHHSVTDVYVPLPGGELSLSVRRNITTDIWGQLSVVPVARLDRPFGPCWSSNLTPGAERVDTAWTNRGTAIPDIPVPVINVTDQNGDIHRFRVVLVTSPTPGNPSTTTTSELYYPYPSSYEEKDECLNSLVMNSDGTLTFTGKFGTVMTFTKISYNYINSESQQYTGQQGIGLFNYIISSHTFYQASSVKDRFGNQLDYTYPSSTTLTPSKISFHNHSSQCITIATNSAGKITSITDPNGNVHAYAYAGLPPLDSDGAFNGSAGALSSFPSSLLSSVTGPVNSSGVSPVTGYSYRFTCLPDQQPIFNLQDTSVRNAMFHLNLASITDPNNKTYSFSYRADATRYGSKKDQNQAEHDFVTNENPFLVTNIQLPDGLGSTAIARSALMKVSGNPGVFTTPIATAVYDAAGNSRVYSFTNYTVTSLIDFFNGPNPQHPLLATFGTTTISYFSGTNVGLDTTLADLQQLGPSSSIPLTSGSSALIGSEIFTFDPAASMGLKSIVDFSGNTTTFEHGDAWNISKTSTAYDPATSLSFPFLAFADPTSETDPSNIPKTFHYTSFSAQNPGNRVMDSVTDREGRTTKYDIQSGTGLRTAEYIYSSTGTLVQQTNFTYDSNFLGFMTSKTVLALDGNSAAPAMKTQYVPDSLGRVQRQIVDPGGLNLTTAYSYDLNNNKMSEIDPRGYETDFHYDGLNQLIEIDYPAVNGGARASKKFVYDPRGNKTQETDENGHVTKFTYDGLNRLVQEDRVMASGGDLNTYYTYNGVNSKMSVQDPNGHTSRMEYDALQRLINSYDALNHKTTYEYGINSGGDSFNVSSFKPTKITDPRGYVTNVQYDNLYRAQQKSVQYQLAVSGSATEKYSTTTMNYDRVGNMISSIDPLANQTLFTYDALNRLTQTQFADATIQTTTYSSTGLKIETKDELSAADPHRVTDMRYDAAGRLTDVIGAYVDNGNGTLTRPVTHTSYDANGNVIATINPLLKEWDYTYDERNRKKTETQPAVLYQGVSSRPLLSFTYDDVGNLLSTTDARGNTTANSYDYANRKTDVLAPAVSAPSGGTAQPHTQMGYDFNGNITLLTDANGHATHNQYDELNRLHVTTDAAGNVVTNLYDEVGNKISVEDGNHHITRFTFDGLNRNTSVIDAASKVTTLNYNDLNKISRVDSLNHETDYGYDLRNRLHTVTYLGRSTDGRIHNYDAVGNLLSVTQTRQSLSNVSYSYDALNRVISETVSGPSANGTVTHSYSLDLAGNRLKTVYGGTGRTITSTYDALNRLSAMTDKTTADIAAGDPGRITSYSYDLNGNIIQKTAPNGDTEAYSFDALNRATVESAQTGTAIALFNYLYSYDLVGNVLTVAETYPGGLNNRLVTNTYDLINRLHIEAVTGNAPNVTTTYDYDAANNRIDKIVAGGAGAGETDYGYNTLNQLTGFGGTFGAGHSSGTRIVTYGYDLNGNRTSRVVTGGSDNGTDTYSYDYENRLVGLTKGTASGAGTYAYQYDYRTRRVTRDESAAGGVKTKVVFSGGTSAYECDNNSFVPTVEYVRGSDYGGGVGGVLYTVRGGTPSYTHENKRGDIVAKTDSSGSLTYQAQYEAFGQQTATSGSTLDRQKSNSKDTDPTGLVDEGFRYRDLETGMFLTRDPAGFVDGPNLYTYVRQNPWTAFDPEGLNETFGYNGWGESLLPDPVADYHSTQASANQLVTGEGAGGRTVGALGVFANGVFFATDLIPGVGAAEKALAKGAAKAVAKDVAENETKQVAEQGAKGKAESEVKPSSTAKDNSPAPANNSPSSGGCFIAGTLVSTPHGDVPIETIRAGDTVWSLDLKTGHVVEKKVDSLFSHVTEYWVDVTVGGERITATRGHRFWVESLKKWIPAQELKPGMKLLGSNGHLVAISEVRVRHLRADERTYNFFVHDTHVYFVGKSHWLVHNGDDATPPPPPPPPKVTSNAARRESMRQQGIPTSQQPSSQRGDAAHKQYTYEVPEEGGGSKTAVVTHHEADNNHPDPHWEAADAKTDNGKLQEGNHGEIKYDSDKSKVNYTKC